MNTAIVGLALAQTKLKVMTDCPEKGYVIALIKDVQESCSEAVKILTGILDYEKLGAGLMTLEQTWVEPLPFLLAAIRPFIMVADSKKISLVCQLSSYSLDDQTTWDMYIDEVKISQVVRNFVSNAIKFTPPGGTITIIPSLVSQNLEKMLRFEVIDSGPGIATSDIGKVFNEVVQFNANTQQGGGGSGIGLWICKKIVNLHGGNVFVESVEGNGCRFVFELKVVRKNSAGESFSNFKERRNRSLKAKGTDAYLLLAGPHRRSQCSPELAAQVTAEMTVKDTPPESEPERRQLDILVVDDSLLNRKMMVRLLEGIGHVCTQAADGKEAVISHLRREEMKQPSFDLILMDNNMPIMSGREATTVLRANGFKGLIIGVTGDALQSDVDAFKASGVNAVVNKPIDPIHFDRILWNLMKKVEDG